MTSLVPAALVVILEAGFLFSVAVLPEPAEPAAVEQVAAGRPAPAPAVPAAPAATADARPGARS